MSQDKLGASLAAAAAALAISSIAFAAENPAGSVGKAINAADKVHCYGIHSCKGNSDCKTAEHACKGKNACSGHGFKAVSAKECLGMSGTIADLKG